MFRRLFLFLFVLPILVSAQNTEEKSKPNKFDPEYIKDYKHLFTTRFYLLNESITFRVKPTNQSVSLNYIPNNDIKNGFAFFHKWYGVGLAIDNPFAGKDIARKGKSSIIDLRLNAYGSALAAELSLQDYQGFYLKNMMQQPISWNIGDVYPQRPDMHIFSTSAILYYIVNHKKHSFRAAYIQNERQLKSSGSLIVMPSFVYLNMSSDSSLIPGFYNNAFEVQESEKILNGKFFTYGISLGYSYTQVFLKYFYINVSFIPGAFIQHYDYEAQSGKIKGTKLSALWLGRAAFGFNSDLFYAGIGGVYGFQAANLRIGQTNFNYDMNQLRLWIGTRF